LVNSKVRPIGQELGVFILTPKGLATMDTLPEHDSKTEAYQFLQDLGTAIVDAAPDASSMGRDIRQIIAAAKGDPQGKHLRNAEAAFLNSYVLPVLHEHLQSAGGLTKAQARDALLNEFYRGMPEISYRSPVSAKKHPFQKLLGSSAGAVYKRWTNQDKNYGLTQSCPDFALGSPFPHSIVFEGKYFSNGSADHAARELVRDIYEAFFYRGLPRVEASKRGHPKWDYDYACLLAYDASPNGTLLNAWDALPPSVKRSFWDGANIYVMILRK